MRRVVLAVAIVGALVVGAGLCEPRQAQAAPGFFSFSVGSPGFYGGYANYPAPYVAPVVPQPYAYGAYSYGGNPYGGYPYGGNSCGGYPYGFSGRVYAGYPYGGFNRGHHGHGNHYGHHRW